jgi:hypothetical protein
VCSSYATSGRRVSHRTHTALQSPDAPAHGTPKHKRIKTDSFQAGALCGLEANLLQTRPSGTRDLMHCPGTNNVPNKCHISPLSCSTSRQVSCLTRLRGFLLHAVRQPPLLVTLAHSRIHFAKGYEWENRKQARFLRISSWFEVASHAARVTGVPSGRYGA